MLGAERDVIGGPGHGAIEDFQRDGDLVLAEQPDRTADGLDAAAIGRDEVPDGRQDERAAHAAVTPLTRAAAAGGSGSA